MEKQQTKQKVKRLRVNPAHRWTEKETHHLLKGVFHAIKADAEAFERPIAQRFYENIARRMPLLREIGWRLMKNKIRHLRSQYAAAASWNNRIGADFIARGEEDIVVEHLNKMCPHWNLLDIIFGQHLTGNVDILSETTNCSGDEAPEEFELKFENCESSEANENSTTTPDPIPEKSEFEFIQFKHDLSFLHGQPKEKEKIKRRRVNPTHRWTERETLYLLNGVWKEIKDDPEAFERPVAQRFYEKIASQAPKIEYIGWRLMRSKMRHLKVLYGSAFSWKREIGASLIAGGEEKSVVEHINKICPNWDMLEKIFGLRISVASATVLETGNASAEEGQEQIRLFSPADDDDSESNEANERITSATDTTLTQQNGFDFIELKRNSPKSKTKLNNSNPYALLLSIQERRLEIEAKRFELEKESTKNEFELRKMELQQQLEIKKLEIAKDERIAMQKLKLEIETQERMKKYELQLNRSKT